MAVKLFVTDLDGTLIHSGKDISEGNRLAVREAVEAGVVFTIATGRMYPSAKPIAQSLGVDVPIITYNGAVVKSTDGRVYLAEYIDSEIVKQVLDYALERNLYVQLYSYDELYYVKSCDISDFYEKASKVKGHAVGAEALYSHMDEVPKLLIVGDTPEASDKIVEELNSKFAGILTAVKSNPLYVEIIKHGVSKASAIKALSETLNISIEDTMAIGDSNNDLPMLKAAGKSVAMGNASDEIKAAADYVTKDCDEDGEAYAIYKYVLNRDV